MPTLAGELVGQDCMLVTQMEDYTKKAQVQGATSEGSEDVRNGEEVGLSLADTSSASIRIGCTHHYKLPQARL